jgi:hypothetical protein
MLPEDDNMEMQRCVEIFLQWSFAFNSNKETFFSATTDAALPSYEDGETYQELAVKSWGYYFDCREMLKVKKQTERINAFFPEKGRALKN